MAEEKEHKKHAGHGYKETHIKHHHDGSHTIHHMHENPSMDKEHAAADLDAVHDSLQDHLGTPNPGEAQANAGPPASMEAPAAPAMSGAMPSPQGA